MTAVGRADLSAQGPVIFVSLYGEEGLSGIVIKPSSCVGGPEEHFE